MAKILLADDDESMRTLVEHIVREMGHDFVAVTDGMAVFDAYAETLPDLLIVDIMMPGSTGSTCVRPCGRGTFPSRSSS